MSEVLWSSAFRVHAYRWSTIGWMPDFDGFTTEDCQEFYRTYYAPNNATLVVTGDVDERALLTRIAAAYGPLESSLLPVEDVRPEPPQVEERQVELEKPTVSEKIAIGYHGPALGDADHTALSALCEVLFGGRASRLHRRLVQELEIATDVRVSVGPFQDPGLVEIYASARDKHTAEALRDAIDAELDRVVSEPVSVEEIDRARARSELGLLAGLETVDGKASTIGFYETVLGRPAAAFDRLEAAALLGPGDLLRAARRYFRRSSRTLVMVRPQKSPASTDPREAAE